MLVSNVKKDGKYIGSLPDGEMWFHHDMCYDKAPHKGTFLYAMELPSTGGNTQFANMYAAYDKLSDDMKQRVQGKRALQIYDFATRETSISRMTFRSTSTKSGRHHHSPGDRMARVIRQPADYRPYRSGENESRAMLDELFARGRPIDRLRTRMAAERPDDVGQLVFVSRAHRFSGK